MQANDYFGTSVALDGNLLAVGSSYDDTGGTNRGAVYLIKDGGDSWGSIAATDITKINHSSTLGITLADNDHFGYGVALDDGIIAVGADGDTSNAGAVYILNDKNNDGDWADTGENTKITNSTPGITLTSGDKFGTALALDNGLLAVGAIGESGGKGAVYLIDDGGDDWGSIAADDSILLDDSKDGISLSANDTFGIGVTLDAGALTVGAHKDDTGGTDRGAVYVFDAAFEAVLATGDFEKGTPATNKLAEGTITVSATPTDLAGNAGTAATGTFTYDQTVPTISSASFSAGSTVTVTMSEDVYAATAPAASDFKVKSGASGSETANVVTGVTGLQSTQAGADDSFTLTVTTALVSGNSVKVYYTKGTNAVTDEAGNDLATLAEGSAVTATESGGTKTVSISAVSTDDYINDTEDESAVTISGTSTGLTSGTTVTVGVDGSGTDISGKTGTTDSDGDWSVSLTSDEVKALDASSPDADGEDLTITATAPNATSGTRTVTYDPTAPTVSSRVYSATSGGSSVDSVLEGSDVFTKITFSEAVNGVVSDTSTARPAIKSKAQRNSSDTITEFQYDVIATGDLASEDCKETGTGNDDKKIYSCQYTTPNDLTGWNDFKTYITAFTDLAGNAGTAETYAGVTDSVGISQTPAALTYTYANADGSTIDDYAVRPFQIDTHVYCASACRATVDDVGEGSTCSGSMVPWEVRIGGQSGTKHSALYSITPYAGGSHTFSAQFTWSPIPNGTVWYGVPADELWYKDSNNDDRCTPVPEAGVTVTIAYKLAITSTSSVSSNGDIFSVSAVDADTGTTTWKYKLLTSLQLCDATTMGSGTSDYTEGDTIEITGTANNSKRVCFKVTDDESTPRTLYKPVTVSGLTKAALTMTVGSVPSGSAASKDISLSSISTGATAKYKIITQSDCNATNYGSGGTALTVSSGSATITVGSADDNNKYACVQISKAGNTTRYYGSGQITGVTGLASPTLALQSPSSSPGNDSTPTIRVTVDSGYQNGTVQLYSDSSCSTSISSSVTVDAAYEDVDTTTLTEANSPYTIHAKHTNSSNVSVCSETSVSYTYDGTAPTATVKSVSGGYVSGTEDDGNVSVYATGNEVLSGVAFSITDSDTTPETLSKTGKRSAVYAEKLSNAMSALTLANSDTFGRSVARDGAWLAVGAPGDDTGNSNAGAVYLIKDGDSDGDWADATSNDVVEINTNTAGITLAASDSFGVSVALDGGLLAVGARADDTGGTDRGAVYLIDDGGNGWADILSSDVTEINEDTAGITLANSDHFGTSVALDGEALAIGASSDDTCPAGGSNCGAVYLIHDGGDDWASVAAEDVTKVKHSSTLGITLGSGDQFGVSVALAGSILAVGAGNDDTGGTNRGAVYILNDKNNDNDWADTGENTVLSNSTDGITLADHDIFGISVAFDRSGAVPLLAVGAQGDDTGGSDRGAVYLITDGGDAWGSVAAADVVKFDSTTDGITLANSDSFGGSVALADGALTISADDDDTGGENRGAVYNFDAAFEAILATGDFEKGTPAANKLAEGTITVSATPTDLAGNAGTAATGTFTYDQTVPTISSASFSAGSTITVTMSEDVYAATAPAASDFKVKSGASALRRRMLLPVTGLQSTQAGADDSFTLTVTTALVSGNSVKVYYTKGTNAVTDEAGNDLATLAEGSAVTASEVVPKTVSISAVSTDDYINDTEDESAVTISGTSTGLTSGTTVTVGVDGSGTDISGKTGTTDSDGDWSVSLTSDEVKALDASSPDADGEDLTITATAPNATSGTRTVTYDPTAPTVSSRVYSATSGGSSVDSVLEGSDVFTKITFSEAVNGVVSDTSTARPAIKSKAQRNSSDTITEFQYDVIATGDLASEDCKETGTGNDDKRYTPVSTPPRTT